MKHLKILVIGLLISQSSLAADGNTKNFRFGALGALVGVLNLHLDFAINEEWTVGPELGYWNFSRSATDTTTLISDIDINAYSVGARANWYNNGVHADGLYVGPSLAYLSLDASATDSLGTVSVKADGMFLSCLVGYGWFWDSFNMLLGGGLTIALGDKKVQVQDSTGAYTELDLQRGGIAFEYTLGWTF